MRVFGKMSATASSGEAAGTEGALVSSSGSMTSSSIAVAAAAAPAVDPPDAEGAGEAVPAPVMLTVAGMPSAADTAAVTASMCWVHLSACAGVGADITNVAAPPSVLIDAISHGEYNARTIGRSAGFTASSQI